MQRKQALVVDYRSMTNEPAIRTLYPTAFAHDGHRWHVRAYCFKSTMFKDFVLGRFLKSLNLFPHRHQFHKMWTGIHLLTW
ncbi:WYL domain-containing protein [Klebsiella variicola subsp. variicola]|nr:WYL domain-containing protein [Klebsiella variicola subsp. variicola]